MKMIKHKGEDFIFDTEVFFDLCDFIIKKPLTPQRMVKVRNMIEKRWANAPNIVIASYGVPVFTDEQFDYYFSEAYGNNFKGMCPN
jgi:hypothetical protein